MVMGARTLSGSSKATLACALAFTLLCLSIITPVSASPVRPTGQAAANRWKVKEARKKWNRISGSIQKALDSLQAPFSGSLLPNNTPVAPITPGLRLLFQNDLDWTTTNQHRGYLLVSTPQTYADANKTCQSLGETLAIPPTSGIDRIDFQRQVAYLMYNGTLSQGEQLWTGGPSHVSNVLQLNSGSEKPLKGKTNAATMRKALCTQSAKRKTDGDEDASSQWRITTRPLNGGTKAKVSTKKKKISRTGQNRAGVAATGATAVTGYRDALSFRFHAIPYANPTERFAYSTVYTPPNDGTLIDATAPGQDRQCPQGSSASSENCLVLNLWTPFLPSAASNPTSKSLKPIMVWFHGGGFNTGSGQDGTFDGGQLSSRGDVVVVTPNYRLGTFGFLPVNRGDNAGNYAVGDCITALKWIQKYAKTFGGDASRVTIFGQSAGARLVEILIGSQPAQGLFHRAILQSDPLGRAGSQPQEEDDYAPRRASTIESLGCEDYDDEDDSEALLECLRDLSTREILNGSPNFNKLTVDGTLIASSGEIFRGETGHVNNVPTIVGFMRDEEASLGSVPSSTQTNETKALQSGGVSSSNIGKVLAHPALFPTNIPHGLVNLTSQVNTDTDFRCGNEVLSYDAVDGGFLTKGVWVYTQDQRAWQIPNYDPNGLCQPEEQGPGASAGNASSYFFCHSGDLLPTFGTPGFEFDLDPRDNQDLIWIRNQIDQWTAFANTGNPNPSAKYLSVRGYPKISGASWPKLDSGRRIMSLGPVQKVVTLDQRGAQCAILRPTI